MEIMVGSAEFKVRTTFTGDVYINEKFYRQLCFTPNQIALAIEDYLNDIPADGEEDEETVKDTEEPPRARVECYLEECEFCKDNYCTASDITLKSEHDRDGGCDYGWSIPEEEEDE